MFYLFHSFYLNLRYYICKILGNLPQKGTLLAILVGKSGDLLVQTWGLLIILPHFQKDGAGPVFTVF